MLWYQKLHKLIICNLNTQRLRAKGSCLKSKKTLAEANFLSQIHALPAGPLNQSLGFSVLEHIRFVFNTPGKWENYVKT